MCTPSPERSTEGSTVRGAIGATRRITALVFASVALGCDRESRDFKASPPGVGSNEVVRTSAVHAGPPVPDRSLSAFQDNAWAASEGQRLFAQMNCAGCHSPGGGGGMGPPLTDAEWRFGSAPENIFDTIIKGRPRGMPSFAGRLSDADVWKLVAYVRTIGGLTRKDIWSPRTEDMSESSPSSDERGGRASGTGRR